MQVWKKFRFVTHITVVFAALLLFVSACVDTTPCVVPNPLIQFNVAQDTFGVTPNAVPNAQTVQIAVFDSTGVLQDTFTVTPGQQQKLSFDDSAKRPLQLKFTYQSASGSIVAEDSIRIDDVANKGVSLPDMDVIVGLLAPGNQLCPNTIGNVTPTITTESSTLKKATFNWVLNDRFEVTLNNGTTSKKFRIHPAPHPTDPDKAGTCTMYNSASYTCATLNPADTDPESLLVMVIEAIADDCKVKGYNDGTTKTISVIYPNACGITVKK